MASVHKPPNLFPPGYQFAVPVLVLFPLGAPVRSGPILLPAFRSSLLHMITPDDVAGLIASLAKHRSRLTAQRVYAVLHKMFEDALTWRDVTANPVAAVDAPANAKALRGRTRFRSINELRAVIAAVAPTWRPMVFVDFLTGLRWGEITAWRWPDLHLETAKASVWQNIPVGESPRVAQRRRPTCRRPVPPSCTRTYGSSAAR